MPLFIQKPVESYAGHNGRQLVRTCLIGLNNKAQANIEQNYTEKTLRDLYAQIY